LENGTSKREVILPMGAWRGFDGKLYQGPAKISLAVGYDELCYFEKSGVIMHSAGVLHNLMSASGGSPKSANRKQD
jgi:hypothetical protein